MGNEIIIVPSEYISDGTISFFLRIMVYRGRYHVLQSQTMGYIVECIWKWPIVVMPVRKCFYSNVDRCSISCLRPPADKTAIVQGGEYVQIVVIKAPAVVSGVLKRIFRIR